MLSGVFGDVIGKIALQNLIDLAGSLKPLPALFGCLTQIMTDPLGLQQPLALEQPIAAHPAASALARDQLSPCHRVRTHPTMARFHSLERYFPHYLSVLR